MSQLLTLTGNLLAETTAYYHNADWQKTQRAYRETFQVGGKGINVSRMAQRLGLDSTAYCFTGGEIGAKCRTWLDQQPFHLKSFELSADNRQGWVVRVDGQEHETTFLGMDRRVPLDSWKQAWSALADQSKAGTWVAVCGSIPGWEPAFLDVMQSTMEAMRDRGVKFVLDTYGPPLASALNFPFEVLKINLDEWQHLADQRGWSEELREGLEAALQECVIQRWIITNGAKETLFVDDHRAFYRLIPPTMNDVRSAVGSGDVTLAGLIAHLDRGESWAGALAEAMRYGAANAVDDGVAAFPLERATQLPLPRAERWY
ncbi:MAG: 1-phosphofructokinase [Puniceicoccaceae bacterium 5H]|nr:MAG: 1-phosphofructokinase [Puniceicoccaceae bacterium 5H]